MLKSFVFYAFVTPAGTPVLPSIPVFQFVGWWSMTSSAFIWHQAS